MKIVISGSVAIDRIMNFNGYFKDHIQPDKLHVLSISVLLNSLRETRGGTAGNMAYTLALLGEEPVLLCSAGNNSRDYMNDLEKMGVNIFSVHYSKLPSASFSVLTDRADCQIGGFYPGAMTDADELKISKFKDDEALIVVSAHDPKAMMRQVAECRDLKKKLFFDVGKQILALSSEELKLGIEVAELLILNDFEMGKLQEKTGWSLEEILAKVQVCVVTLGNEGCRVHSEENDFIVPAFRLKEVVDPTGAGDAFRAGFLFGYSRFWSAKICAQLGVVAAAYAVEKLGTQEHHFTIKEFTERYAQMFGKIDLNSQQFGE